MSEDGSGSFFVAFITRTRPVEVRVMEYEPPAEPFEVIDGGVPRNYDFEPRNADSAVFRAGYERTSAWELADETWAAVVQPRKKEEAP